MPTSVERIRREHLEAFLTDLRARRAPATAHNRFVSLMDGAWIELAIDSGSDTPEASSLAYIRLAMAH